MCKDKDEIFAEAAKQCGSFGNKTITRKTISKVIRSDETDTIKKYLNSFGITQLAMQLSLIGRKLNPPLNLVVGINDEIDRKQNPAQKPLAVTDATGKHPNVKGMMHTLYGNGEVKPFNTTKEFWTDADAFYKFGTNTKPKNIVFGKHPPEVDLVAEFEGKLDTDI